MGFENVTNYLVFQESRVANNQKYWSKIRKRGATPMIKQWLSNYKTLTRYGSD